MEDLIQKFKAVGLSLAPWKNQGEIFSATIQKDKFLIDVGSDNDVQVRATDPNLSQLILQVKELSREFEVTIHEDHIGKGDRVLSRLPKDMVIVRRKTQEFSRSFLLGRDEMGHPFITQLTTPANSVREAHEKLKPIGLKDQKVKGFGKNYKKAPRSDLEIFRQGEWFFSEVSSEEQVEIDKRLNLVERKVSIGPAFDGTLFRRKGSILGGGNPHVAEELLSIRDSVTRFPSLYVRGSIRHSEHRTLKFLDWMRVQKNNEVSQARGVAWVD